MFSNWTKTFIIMQYKMFELPRKRCLRQRNLSPKWVRIQVIFELIILNYNFQVILEKTIRIPRSLSVKAASVLKGFLNKNPVERLGCGEAGFLDIVNHPFFKSIEWEMVWFSSYFFFIDKPPYNKKCVGSKTSVKFQLKKILKISKKISSPIVT